MDNTDLGEGCILVVHPGIEMSKRLETTGADSEISQTSQGENKVDEEEGAKGDSYVGRRVYKEVPR